MMLKVGDNPESNTQYNVIESGIIPCGNRKLYHRYKVKGGTRVPTWFPLGPMYVHSLYPMFITQSDVRPPKFCTSGTTKLHPFDWKRQISNSDSYILVLLDK